MKLSIYLSGLLILGYVVASCSGDTPTPSASSPTFRPTPVGFTSTSIPPPIWAAWRAASCTRAQ
jgi:hypothetical protein